MPMWNWHFRNIVIWKKDKLTEELTKQPSDVDVELVFPVLRETQFRSARCYSIFSISGTQLTRPGPIVLLKPI